ncbi:Lrp/AsnC family transcriptional regulator [Halovivax limisalsi]|uniref:Lrp/AsnC family transcriptional regulator n=1 Tax=Halovivax limisalsi TaxID=1453760 RepID=UPI001FFCF422|nr:Lrp/AsnC ligand binding domain-containing protein [Halovivax limisalsi]
MSVIAYVLVKANTGEAERLQAAIESIDGVESVHVVAGDVDLIAKTRVENPAAVKRISATEVQGIDGVEGTKTYIAME